MLPKSIKSFLKRLKINLTYKFFRTNNKYSLPLYFLQVQRAAITEGRRERSERLLNSVGKIKINFRSCPSQVPTNFFYFIELLLFGNWVNFFSLKKVYLIRA